MDGEATPVNSLSDHFSHGQRPSGKEGSCADIQISGECAFFWGADEIKYANQTVRSLRVKGTAWVFSNVGQTADGEPIGQ